MLISLTRAWQHTAWRLGLMLLACSIAGALLGYPWQGLCAGLAIALLWHYVNLHLLLRRLLRRERIALPDGLGIFSELGALLHRGQREGHQRKLRLLRLLRAFREAAAALPDAVVVLQRGELRIEWFNESATRLLGLHYPRDFGARFSNLVRTPRVTEWLAEGAAEPLLDVPAPGNEVLRLSLRLIDYTPDQQLLVARDVSKLMQLEQVRRDFVANVSHELRTPLTVIHGYLDILDPEDLPGVGHLLTEMRQQSRRMTQIVEDLLTLSRLEARDRLPQERVSMAPMLIALRRDAEALSQGRHQVNSNDEADCDLLGSPKELHSAFSNLVSNAVRYTPDGGRIDIRLAPIAADTTHPQGAVGFFVTDTGYGIPPQHLPRITERFYRVSDSRSRDRGGTGLGLAIVKHVLNLHDARLEVTSEPGCGSTFCAVFGPGRTLLRSTEAATGD